MRDHRDLVLWAVDCARRVLPKFETKYPDDDRPRHALDAGRTWVRRGLPLSDIRAAALDAHAAARDAEDASARAAGQAAAAAHAPGHALAAAAYAVVSAGEAAAGRERDRQCRRLLECLRSSATAPRDKNRPYTVLRISPAGMEILTRLREGVSPPSPARGRGKTTRKRA